jgi:hypothetical protein
MTVDGMAEIDQVTEDVFETIHRRAALTGRSRDL